MKIAFPILIVFFISSCTYEKLEEPVPDNGYPAEVSALLVNRCATEGCHNSASRNSVSGIDYSTWDLMVEG